MKRIHAKTYSVLLFLLLIVGWQLVASSLPEIVLPRPTVVMQTFIEGFRSGYFLPHIWQTFQEVMLGLFIGAVLGLTVGILMGELEFMHRLLMPYVIASQAVPKLALAPLFILWFGFGMTSKVVITALVCFFPLLENTMSAVKHVERNKLELFRSLRASRMQILFQLKIPAGLPTMMAGFRIAVILAIVGAVVGEFIGASQGLGALIIASQG